MAPFGFRKKEREPPVEPERRASYRGSPVTVTEAQDLLRRVDADMLASLQHQLEPVRKSTVEVLSSLGQIAQEMEQEKIKLEDAELRHKATIENSRRAIVSTLKREGSAELALPQSVNEVKKFREKMESIMSRFGEVSGSHSKLLNYFLKKHSSRMKNQFSEMDSLLKQTRSIISEFESRREPVVKCQGMLNTAVQLQAGSKSAESAIKSFEEDVKQTDEKLSQTRRSLQALTSSPEYPASIAALEMIPSLEARQAEHRQKVSTQFSFISRVLSKYSYGLGKEAAARIALMSEEPWRVLEQELAPYYETLGQMKKSIQEGTIQIKDSDKTVVYIDAIIQGLPGLKKESEELDRAMADAASNPVTSLARQSKELETAISALEEKLSSERQSIELQKRQLAEKREDVKRLLTDAEKLFADLGLARTIEA